MNNLEDYNKKFLDYINKVKKNFKTEEFNLELNSMKYTNYTQKFIINLYHIILKEKKLGYKLSNLIKKSLIKERKFLMMNLKIVF